MSVLFNESENINFRHNDYPTLHTVKEALVEALENGGSGTSEKTFTGTTEEWEALTTAQKIEYDFADLTDDYEEGAVVDTVADGNMNPVTSNAVADALKQETVTVTKETGETYGDMLDRLFAAIDLDKVTPKTTLVIGTAVHQIVTWSTAELRFIRCRVSTDTTTTTIMENYTVKSTGSAVSTSTISESSQYNHTDNTEDAGPAAMTIYY